MPELPLQSPPPPFRHEVPVVQFEGIERMRNEVNAMRMMEVKPTDRYASATLLQETLFSPDSQPEGKILAYQTMVEMIDRDVPLLERTGLTEMAIDSIRAEKNVGLRLRMASVLSHSAQDKYVKIDDRFSMDEVQIKALEDVYARRAALNVLAKDKKMVQPKYWNWARYIRNEEGPLQVFNMLYDKDPNLEMVPKIIEDITEESPGPEEVPVEQDLQFTGDLLRLDPPRLPTLEKIEQYRAITGRDFPIFLTRRAGSEFIHVEFPSDLSARAMDLARQFREATNGVTRRQVFENAQALSHEFYERMNPEQRQELLSHNIEIRFSTERSSTTPPAELSPQDEKPEEQAA